MSRKPKKGYFVRGEFVTLGSELDVELKAELRGTTEQSKTDLKRESTELQVLGGQLLTLGKQGIERLGLPERLVEAVGEAKRITNFEGKRRQMQLVGKLMRALDPALLQTLRAALDSNAAPSAQDTLALHQAEQWRDQLIADDGALERWLRAHPDTDTQKIRALIRQARKDAAPVDPGAHSKGLAPRQGRAYREIFQLVKEHLAHESST